MNRNLPFILIIGLLLLCGMANAVENREFSVVRIGVFPVEPLTLKNKKGEIQGLFPDIIREIFLQENIKIKFVYDNLGHMLKQLQDRQIDLMASVAHSPERDKFMDFSSEAVIDIWGQVFIRPGDKISNFLDLNGLKIAIARKGIDGKNFKETASRLGVKFTAIELNTHEEVFRALQQGLVDAGVSPQHYGLRYASDYGLVGSTILFSPFSVYFGVKKGENVHLLTIIDKYLSNWKKDKDSFYYQRLGYWLGGREFEKKVIPQWLLIALGAIGIVAVLLMGMIRLLNHRVNVRTNELRRSKETFKTLFNESYQLIWLLDAKGNLLDFNHTAKDFLQYDLERNKKRPIWDCPCRVEDTTEKQLLREAVQKAIGGETARLESSLTTHDGKEHYLDISIKPVHGQKGNIIMLIQEGRDITEKKIMEEQLRKSQRMESIGLLAGGIAHDFNNILSGILGFSELTVMDIRDGNMEEAEKHILESMKGGERARDLVQQILAFSRKTGEEKKHPVYLYQLLKETIRLLRASIPAEIGIRLSGNSSCPPIMANPTQIHQVLMNLCTNAWHSMREKGGLLKVGLGTRIIDQTHPEENLPSGEYAVITIQDEGHGIDPAIQERIFEPYFTTKNQNGTGLGLSVVHGIVMSHNGKITLESTIDQGTVFFVYLPCINEEVPEIDDKKGYLPSGNEQVMLVDDEISVLTVHEGFLQRLGYTVYPFSSSMKALAWFKETDKQVDLLITDMSMPKMTGYELVSKIRTTHPDLPVIITTGYSDNLTQEKMAEIGSPLLLEKPLSLRELAFASRKAIDGESV